MKHKNPFLRENQTEGSGKLAVVTESYIGLNNFESPCWWIKQMEDGRENERSVSYTLGKSFVPTPDGKGWTKGGKPAALNSNSQAGKFAGKLEDGGFPMEKLYDENTGMPDVSALVGGTFELEFLQELDRDGKPKTWTSKQDGQLRDSLKTWLTSFIEFQPGMVAESAAPTFNDEDVEAFRGVVADIIKEAGGTLSRSKIIGALTGRDDVNNNLTPLLLKASFNEGAPWTLDGTTYNL
jgi:hypothetical protein